MSRDYFFGDRRVFTGCGLSTGNVLTLLAFTDNFSVDG